MLQSSFLHSRDACVFGSNAAQIIQKVTHKNLYAIRIPYICGDQKENILMNEKAFQEYYATGFSHCYGCGTSNEHGLHVKSYWAEDEPDVTVAHFTPEPHHTGGFPGFVYGGLIAAILDCHGNGTAAAAGYRHQGRSMDTEPNLRYVTANLNLNFRRPTPMGQVLELRARIVEVTDRKVQMDISLVADGEATVEGTMLSVLLPEKR